jgi:1-acyl-sn-glycerol-3-phosphate acyltransferase
VESVVGRAATPLRRFGFPYRAPTVPKGVEVPREPSQLGAEYDTEWARTPLARAARGVITEVPLRLLVRSLASPEVVGLDRLADLTALDDPPAVIFAPNHHSHLDTGLMITAIPRCWRRDLVVAAAADYFFDRRWKAAISALSLNAIPIDREVTGRRSSDMFRDLIADGHSLLIYPEGGRSPDGWGQEFKGGAAYLSSRTGAPVVPVFIDGTGAIFGKGMKRPKPGHTKVVFGAPLAPRDDENTRRYNARIEAAVTRLGDEALTDFWTASRRSAAGTSPRLTGPEFNGWRRQWELAEHRKSGAAALRRRQRRRWPDLG